MYIGWRVVAGAFFGMVLANGMFTYAFTVLVDPIREEFDASLEQVMYGLTLGTLFGLIMGPIVGALIDRFSVRLLMTLGCLLTASGLFAISNAQSIGAFSWLLAATMSLSLATMSSMPGSAVVSRWFSTNRGRALGIASIGSSFGGVLVPALLTFWISLYGWRDALQMMALVTVVFVMPIIWLTVRNRPSDLGLTVEDQSAPAEVSWGDMCNKLKMDAQMKASRGNKGLLEWEILIIISGQDLFFPAVTGVDFRMFLICQWIRLNMHALVHPQFGFMCGAVQRFFLSEKTSILKKTHYC